METINLGADEGMPPVPWDLVEAKLADPTPPPRDAHNTRTTWLTTINADGSPHVTPVGALWHGGACWFQTGDRTHKRHNVARDPRCTIAVSVPDADIVVQGEATRVTDPALVAEAAKAWADGGWPAEPDPSGTGITAPYNAP